MDGASRGAGLIVARVLVGLGLLTATLWVLQPFLEPAAWAAIASYVTWPIYARVRAWTKRPVLTAALLTFLLAAIIAIPAPTVKVPERQRVQTDRYRPALVRDNGFAAWLWRQGDIA